MTPRRLAAVALLASAAAPFLALPACTTVSGTKRTQLNFLSEADERQLGDEAYSEALAAKGVRIVRSGPDDERVQRVARRIEAAAARLHRKAVQGFAWQWTVIDDPRTVNAWALPGGKSAVYTGILPIAKSDDELAIVMGHEGAHAIARHGGERISSDAVLNGALTGAGMALGDLEPGTQQAVMAALGAGVQYGMVLPWSRTQESEADELGLMIAADAGYDPRAAIPFWQSMAAEGGAKPPEWLSTHPSDDTRVARLRALMPRALKLYAAACARDGGPAPGSKPLGPPPTADDLKAKR